MATYIAQNELPLNPIYAMGYHRVGCWACLQDLLHSDSGVMNLRQAHPALYATLKKKFGDKMQRLFTTWAGLKGPAFEEEDFDNLYRPCFFDAMGQRISARYKKAKRNQEQRKPP